MTSALWLSDAVRISVLQLQQRGNADCAVPRVVEGSWDEQQLLTQAVLCSGGAGTSTSDSLTNKGTYDFSLLDCKADAKNLNCSALILLSTSNTTPFPNVGTLNWYTCNGQTGVKTILLICCLAVVTHYDAANLLLAHFIIGGFEEERCDISTNQEGDFLVEYWHCEDLAIFLVSLLQKLLGSLFQRDGLRMCVSSGEIRRTQ